VRSNNPPRDLDAIAADIHRVKRSKAFEVGALLVEAWDACDHGQWLDWLDSEFDMTERTAQNYMAAARLKTKYETVSYLPLPARVIYDLASDVESEDLPAVIAALAKAAEGKSKTISVGEAEDVIRLARLRHEFGDHHESALGAMADVDGQPWGEQAIAALKEARPTTDEAATAVVNKFRRAHVASLYAPHGELPDDVPGTALDSLEQVPEDRREHVLQMLQEAPRPLTDDVVDNIIRAAHAAQFASDNDDDLDRTEAEEAEADEAEAKAAAAEAAAAAEKRAAEAASRNDDVGPASKGEVERLQIEIDDLRNHKRRLEIENTGLRRQVEDLTDALTRLLREESEGERAEVMRSLAEKLGIVHHQAAA
jgi:FtsZ-binding cell division protein ZapB